MPARLPQDVDLGLKVLKEPEACTIDVVAIHGTGAHPDDTWCQLREPGLPVGDPKSYINWLSDPVMLPDVLKTARIMRYGYESAWFGSRMISTSASEVSRGLLKELNLYRRDNKRRPLLIIAHSFGGLVTMRMLKEAADEYADIYVSLVGLIFFGTPFRGSESLSQQTLLRLAHEHHERVDESQLRAFDSDSQHLRDLMTDFMRTLRNIPMPRVLCVYEMVQTDISVVVGQQKGSTNYCLWVNQTSATLDRSDDMIDNDTRQCDHLRLNKYRHPELNEFRRLAYSLRCMAEEANELARTRRRALRERLDRAARAQLSAYVDEQGRAAPGPISGPEFSKPKPAVHFAPVLPKRSALKPPQASTITTQEPFLAEQRSKTPSPARAKQEMRMPWQEPGWFDAEIGGEDSQVYRLDLGSVSVRQMCKEETPLVSERFSSKILLRTTPCDENRNWKLLRGGVEASSTCYTVKFARTRTGMSREKMLGAVRRSYLASTLAKAFNDRIDGPVLNFRASSFLEDRERGLHFLLQPYLGNELIHYDYPLEMCSDTVAMNAAICRAFTHFTFEFSEGELLVSNLRGVDLMLDTPLVNKKMLTSNLGRNQPAGGTVAFFEQHVCNEWCRKLLLPERTVNSTADWIFLKTAEPQRKTVACSNVLCRQLFETPSAATTVEGLEYRFCQQCGPQLAIYAASIDCRYCSYGRKASSDFWYTARGLALPGPCSHAQEEFDALSRTENAYVDLHGVDVHAVD